MIAGETAPFEKQVSLYGDEMELYKRLINMIANNTAPSGASSFEELEYQDWFEAMVGLYSPDIIDKAKDFSQPFGKIYDRIARYHNDLECDKW